MKWTTNVQEGFIVVAWHEVRWRRNNRGYIYRLLLINHSILYLGKPSNLSSFIRGFHWHCTNFLMGIPIVNDAICLSSFVDSYEFYSTVYCPCRPKCQNDRHLNQLVYKLHSVLSLSLTMYCNDLTLHTTDKLIVIHVAFLIRTTSFMLKKDRKSRKSLASNVNAVNFFLISIFGQNLDSTRMAQPD